MSFIDGFLFRFCGLIIGFFNGILFLVLLLVGIVIRLFLLGGYIFLNWIIGSFIGLVVFLGVIFSKLSCRVRLFSGELYFRIVIGLLFVFVIVVIIVRGVVVEFVCLSEILRFEMGLLLWGVMLFVLELFVEVV